MTAASLAGSRVYTDFSALARLRAQARADSPAARQEVAVQMESIFLQMMLKSMRKASFSGGLFDNDASKTYQSMMDQQLALVLAGREPGLGLKQMILQQLPKAKNSAGSDDGRVTTTVVHPSSVPFHRTAMPGHYGLYAAQQTPALLGSSALTVGSVIPVIPATEPQTQKRTQKITFIRQVLPHAQQAAQALYVPAEVLVAQTALETGWGKYMPRQANGQSSFNYFGIKVGQSWKGLVANTDTTEVVQGQTKAVVASFRAYSDPRESFTDYVDLIKTSPRYRQVLQSRGDSNRYVDALQGAGYATDPQYAKKIRSILESPTFSSAFKNLVNGSIAAYGAVTASINSKG
ncbi:MAG TPA: flagellar assembly peptidoglycan hydrolase FlgJ [Gammaproteobacteria bacterium]|nr:flagellar assembly peptidoglycan hydrolase FlgJ [Gammaproteobacteria bacterium]